MAFYKKKKKAPVMAKGGKPRKIRGVMNATEKWYQDTVLEPQLKTGKILAYSYESHTLRLADKTTYTPDFTVLNEHGFIEHHEVKGSWKAPNANAGRVKLKVAAEMYPYYLFKVIVIQSKTIKSEEYFND